MGYQISDITQEAISTETQLGVREFELGGLSLGPRRMKLTQLRKAILLGTVALGFNASDPIVAGAAAFNSLSVAGPVTGGNFSFLGSTGSGGGLEFDGDNGVTAPTTGGWATGLQLARLRLVATGIPGTPATFTMQHYQFGFSVTYPGTIEILSSSLSIRTVIGSGAGAIGWVGNENDTGGFKLTATTAIGSEISSQTFADTSVGNFRLRLPSTADHFSFRFGPGATSVETFGVFAGASTSRIELNANGAATGLPAYIVFRNSGTARWNIGLNVAGLVSADEFVIHANGVGIAFTIKQDLSATFANSISASSFIGALVGNANTATKLATARTISASGDISFVTSAFDGSGNVSGVATLATVVSAGSAGSSSAIPVVTIDANGRTTSLSSVSIVAPAGALSGTALAANVVNSSLTSVGTLTNLTINTGLTLTGVTITGAPTWSSNQTITLATAAQPNVTSVGTLIGLTLSGSLAGIEAAFSVSRNAAAQVTQTNTSGSGAAFAGTTAFNDATNQFSVRMLSSGFTTSGAAVAGAAYLVTDGTGGLSIATANASAAMRFYAGGVATGNLALTIASSGAAAFASTIATADPGSGVGAWKLGKKISGSGLGIVTNNYVEIMIDGALVKLAEAA